MDRKQFNNIYNQAITDYDTSDTFRKGQCLFSLFNLYLYEEQWFRDLIGTNKDCFYNDDNVDNFLTEIKKHLTDMKYIDIPNGYELDTANSTLNKIALRPIYPTYKDILEYPVNMDYQVHQSNKIGALVKLFDIANYYNNNWHPYKEKYYIAKWEDDYVVRVDNAVNTGVPYFISEKDAQAVIDNPNFREILDEIFK